MRPLLNISYSEIIHRNGDVELCYVPTVVTNGVGGHNKKTYHICCIGNGSFTAAQEQSLLERIRFNMNRFGVPISRVKGHNEFLGHRSNVCPGRNMNTLRNQLNAPARPTTPTPTTNQNTHVVQRNETLSGIAARHRTTVAELQRLNNITNANVIHPGQILRLPGGANNNMHLVTTRTGGFKTAADALNNRNRRTWVQPGTYHVFNRSNGMINVTSRKGTPGSWINPNR